MITAIQIEVQGQENKVEIGLQACLAQLMRENLAKARDTQETEVENRPSRFKLR